MVSWDYAPRIYTHIDILWILVGPVVRVGPNEVNRLFIIIGRS
jgi:hypothetical protein